MIQSKYCPKCDRDLPEEEFFPSSWKRRETHVRCRTCFNDPTPVVKGPNHPYWKRRVKYGSAHLRVKAAKGPASEYDCEKCGHRACDWAYDTLDPNELFEEGKGHYSTNPAHYMPMCGRCHRGFDRSHRAASIEQCA